MKLGVVFPQVEIEPDPDAIRTYAEAVTGLGLDHILVYDHVLGVDPEVVPGWTERAHRNGATSAKPYDVHDRFHEVMVLLGFLAAVCPLDLVTGVLVLPQRQTALVAKQAAEVDVLSGGRLRLGVGIGWNAVEYRGMGQDFSTRGRRLDEQIDVLRRFWTAATVRYASDRHWADGVGIAPLPVQRPIPLWLGAGGNRRALERVGRLGDGWLPVTVDPGEAPAQLAVIREAALAAGRDPGEIGIHARVEGVSGDDAERVAETVEAWRRVGATHVALNTMRAGLGGVDGHVEALRRTVAAVAA